jgi:hypothetical protein
LSETVVYCCGIEQLVVDEDRFAGMLAEVRPHLNELQRRLLLEAQTRSLGRGGIRRVAALAGVHCPSRARTASPQPSGSDGVPLVSGRQLVPG